LDAEEEKSNFGPNAMDAKKKKKNFGPAPWMLRRR